jgi:hypothetical protein
MPRRKDEPQLLSAAAQRVLKVLRREHELASRGRLVFAVSHQFAFERSAATAARDEEEHSEVALEVSYANPSHFAKLFRIETGRSPSDYRRHR